VYKTIPHTLEDEEGVEEISTMGFQQFSDNSNTFTGLLSAFSQEGKYSSSAVALVCVYWTVCYYHINHLSSSLQQLLHIPEV
jgi:hypothetical protein